MQLISGLLPVCSPTGATLSGVMCSTYWYLGITRIDSLSTSVGLGFVALAAARWKRLSPWPEKIRDSWRGYGIEEIRMKLPVELFGLARRLSGEKEVTVEVGDEATLRDVVVALAERFPAFLGPLVVPQTYDLVDPYFFNYDGRRMARSLDEKPQENDRLLLFFVTLGG